MILDAEKSCHGTFTIILTECNIQILRLREILVEINELNTKWFMKDNIRKSRGIMNSVGSTLNYLFGVMSNEDAEFFTAKFRELEESNSFQIQMLQHQTTIIQSVFNQINSTIQNQNLKIGQLIEFVRADRHNATRNRGFLTELTQYIFMSLFSFQHKQNLLIEAISVSQNNPNTPFLIPPKTFYEELQRIERNIANRSLFLPFELRKDTLFMFYRTSTVESTIYNGHLIINYKIPLIAKDEFNLYKSTSLPYRVKDTIFSYIVPQYEYTAFDKRKQNFIPISENVLSQCTKVSTDSFICKRSFPILRVTEQNNCEVNLIRELGISNSCNIRLSNITKEMWIKMTEENNFIYIMPFETPVTIVCGNDIFSHYLENTGVISILPHCEIETPTMSLHGFQTIKSSYSERIYITNLEYEPLTKLFNTSENTELLNIPKIDFPTIFNNGEKEALIEISAGLTYIQNKAFETKKREIIENRQTNYFYLGLTLTTTFVSVFVYLYIKIRKLHICKSNSSPVARSYFSNEENEQLNPPPTQVNVHIQTNSEQENTSKHSNKYTHTQQ